MKILHVKYSREFGSQFEALGVLGSKSSRTQTLIFFKMGVSFLQLFDRSTPKASNQDPRLRDYFTHKFLKILAPSNQNI